MVQLHLQFYNSESAINITDNKIRSILPNDQKNRVCLLFYQFPV